MTSATTCFLTLPRKLFHSLLCLAISDSGEVTCIVWRAGDNAIPKPVDGLGRLYHLSGGAPWYYYNYR